jgi:hypothetical protein
MVADGSQLGSHLGFPATREPSESSRTGEVVANARAAGGRTEVAVTEGMERSDELPVGHASWVSASVPGGLEWLRPEVFAGCCELVLLAGAPVPVFGDALEHAPGAGPLGPDMLCVVLVFVG